MPFNIPNDNVIDIRYHFLRDQVGKNMIKLEYCREDQIADIFTKPLKINAFIKLKDLLGQDGCSKSELREDVGY